MNISMYDIKVIGSPVVVGDIQRDPNFVFSYAGELYRLIINSDIQSGRWANIQEFVRSPVFQALMEKEYVPRYELTDTWIRDYHPKGDIYKIVDKIYCLPPEFRTINQKLECVKLACEIHLLLKDVGSPYLLSDINGYQFGFNYYKPMYIDVGSFSTKAFFVEDLNRILAPLGLGFTDWESLLDSVNNYNAVLDKGLWGDYGSPACLAYESKIVCDWLSSKKDIKIIIDVGCCKGVFSTIFNKMGYKVIAIDNEEYVLNELYKNSKGTNIFCLHLDVTKNYEGQWSQWIDKINADVVFCSSITHHLCRAGFYFEEQANLWNKIGGKYLIIEYIDRKDFHVKEWKDVDEVKYTEDRFLQSLEKNWNLLDIKPGEPGAPERHWYFFERRGSI